MSNAGRRMLVVGASSGIGAAIARAGVRAGWSVAVAARRTDLLEALVAEMGGGVAFTADAADPDEARRAVQHAAVALGGLDLVVYSAGFGVLQPLVDTDPETWTSVYRVNVVGANLVAAAAIEHLNPDGVMAFVSSRTVEDTNGHFASYAASKAALDHCIRTWRVEHPDRRFTRIVMGNCQPTQFAEHMGWDRLGDAMALWEQQAIPGGLMDVVDVGSHLVATLGVALDHPEIDSSEIKIDARLPGLKRQDQ